MAILTSVERRGAYPADRAAALSGVPKSTVHYWARKEILVPSVSPARVKLWSYPDLMGLRVIAWLRAHKRAPDGEEVPSTAMPAIRRALGELSQLDLRLWSEQQGPAVAVDRAGRVVIDPTGRPQRVGGQGLLDAESLDLLAPFTLGESVAGPDLVAPRPRLRIVPGKLSGSPHVQRTRVETEALAALARRGMATPSITGLYPMLSSDDVDQALDLERELQPDLALAA